MVFRHVRRLRIGGLTKDELLERLAARSVSLNQYARTLFADNDFTTSNDVTDIDLAIVSVPEIGLPDGGTYADILANAAKVGLRPCPLEVAPHLRLDYLDQPAGPYLTVASLELRPGPDTPNGFYLRRLDDGPWLRGYESGPENIYPPDFTKFVFLLPDRHPD